MVPKGLRQTKRSVHVVFLMVSIMLAIPIGVVVLVGSMLPCNLFFSKDTTREDVGSRVTSFWEGS